MKKSLLLLVACLATLGTYAQDDDVYFVPSSKNKTVQQEQQNPVNRSTYTPITEEEQFSESNWAENRGNNGWDVDEYNRRGKRYKGECSDTVKDSSCYDQGYSDGFSDGYEDASYTSRIVRFYAPRPGIYVSSPYYWDYYDYAYDPWYYGYGNWALGFYWDGWWGWGSWYGWRPYYTWGWYDPFWCAPHHHHYWAAVPATGPTYRYGNSHRHFSPTASRTGRNAVATRTSRDAAASRNGLGFNRSSRNSQRSTTSPSRSTRWNTERSTQPSTRSFNNSSVRSNMGGSFRSSGGFGGSRGGFHGGARGGRR